MSAPANPPGEPEGAGGIGVVSAELRVHRRKTSSKAARPGSLEKDSHPFSRTLFFLSLIATRSSIFASKEFRLPNK